MTSNDLLLQLCVHEVQINQHADRLARVRQFFNGTELWPDQCEYAINVFSSALKPIHSLNKLLDASGISSRDVNINRYSLLVQSHYVEQSIVDILSRLKIHKRLCHAGLKNEHPEYKEMIGELESLWKNYMHLTDTVGKITASAPPKTSYIS